MRISGLIQLLASGAMVFSLTSFSVRAQPPAKTQTVQETDDEVKVNLYTKFVNNYKTNKPVAYETAKAYLQRYAKDKDDLSKYVQDWVAGYEIELRQGQLRQLVYDERNFVEAFKLGKRVMADEPDHLDSLIALGNAGYLAATARNEVFNAEAMGYAKKAIEFIEGGKVPENWAPFKGKDDTLAYLYYTVGLLSLKSTPNEAIENLIKAAQLESELKKLPGTYYVLAVAYETGPYAKMSADYQKNFADKPETPERKQAIEKLNQVIDRAIDAYARAVAAAGNDPKNAQSKATSLNRLTVLYKFRHENSDAGLNELIASVLSKPLPPKP